MTDAEISRRLALAIGWENVHVILRPAGAYVIVPGGEYGMRRVFSYRDHAVIWPIAERFNCFPNQDYSGNWFAWVGCFPQSCADTAAKAVALAVIKAKEQK
jgi:hypothetical protein